MKVRGATIVAWAVLMGGTTSCVNLSHIHDFSTAAMTGLDKYADIGFSATGYCREILCLDPSSYKDGILRKVEKCDCHDFIKADETIRTINKVLTGYWENAGSLTGTPSTFISYTSLSAAVNGLTENLNLGFTSGDVRATRDILSQISSGVFSGWRKKKIKQLIERSNTSIGIVVTAQQKNVVALRKILNDERLEIQAAYRTLADNTEQPGVRFLLNTARVTRDSALVRQDLLLTKYSSILGKIATGQQNLYQARQKLTDHDFISALLTTTAEMADLFKEFRQLEK